MSLSLSFLGAPQVVKEGTFVEIESRKGLALLAYLALHQMPLPRDRIASVFWPESDSKRARGTLRYTLSVLRKALGTRWLYAGRDRLGINWAAGVSCDVIDFRRHLASAERAAREDEQVAALIQAVELYRDDFLAGFTLSDAPAFDEWQLFETETLWQAHNQALEKVVPVLVEREDPRALAYAHRWVALDPLHEPAQEKLIWLYAYLGHRTEALQQYESYKRLLDETFNVRPSPKVAQLGERIRTGTVRPAPQAASPSAPVGPNPTTPLDTLPVPATTFVGREADLAAIAGLFAQRHVRLLTLVGPGGVGKTRLAIEAATAQKDRFRDGVCYVDLTALQLPDLLADTILGTVNDLPRRPDTSASQLIDYLQDKAMLLVLDNFEHLLENSRLLQDILAGSRHVRVLVTSREALTLDEEQRYAVQGLPFPPEHAASPGGYDAVQLFARRAQQVRPSFSLERELPAVVDICRLVEGMPLGIELAAKWVKLLPCAEIVRQITHNLDFLTGQPPEDGPQRNLRALFEHAWRQLSAGEKEALAALSIFQGGFTREAAEAVAIAPLPILRRLMDKSLLRRTGERRYALHELIRQYAGEKRQDNREQARRIRDRHATFFTQLVADVAHKWESPAEQEALATLLPELQNIRSGWSWVVAEQRETQIYHYLDGLYQFHLAASLYREGATLFGQAIATVEANAGEGRTTAALLARLLVRQAAFLTMTLEPARAGRLLERALPLLAAEEPPDELALVHYLLGQAHQQQGCYTRAQASLEKALYFTQKRANPPRSARILLALGTVTLRFGDYVRAQQWARLSHNLYKRMDRPLGIARTLQLLADIARTTNNHTRADTLYRQALNLSEQQGSPLDVAACMIGLGRVCRMQDKHRAARDWYDRSLQIAENKQFRLLQGRVHNELGYLHYQVGAYREAKQHFHRALGITVEDRTTPLLLQTALGITTVLVSQIGERVAAGETGDRVVALSARIYRVLGLLEDHPSIVGEARRDVQRLRKVLAPALPPDPATGPDTGVHDTLPLEELIPLLLSTGETLLLNE